MSTPKEDVFNNFSIMSYELNKLFNRLLKSKSPPRMSCQQTWCPPCDVYETPRNITVRLEVPGVSRKDVTIVLDHNVLYIRGQRREIGASIKTNYYQMEIHYGAFERAVLLPSTIAIGKIKTVYENGFIEIVIPKKK